MVDHIAFAAGQYQELRRRLLIDEPNLDDRTLADTIEGLSDLPEILSAVLREVLFDEALASGLKDKIERMEQRLRRFDERAARRRQIVRDVMVQTGIKKLNDAEFTASVRAGTSAVVVTDEQAVPAQFWEPREPRLNRQRLLGELKIGVEIPGVALSNPEPVST